ncbi:MAG: hypothetical protein LBF15_01005 [Candidatus Peribacteria bacterium]|nr:hypothetical protein [Candidatus Peribacteria bacterium]
MRGDIQRTGGSYSIITLSSIFSKIPFIIDLSCHFTGQALVIIKCSSHFPAISKTSQTLAAAIHTSIASFLVGII